MTGTAIRLFYLAIGSSFCLALRSMWINHQLLLTIASTSTFFCFLPLKIGGDAMEGSSDGGCCVGLETIVEMECDEIPLDLRLRTPFLLPLTFEETGGFAKVIDGFSTNHKYIGSKKKNERTCYRGRPEQLGE